MIETILIVLAGLSLIAVIFFLIQYGLRIRYLQIKEKEQDDLVKRTKEHQDKLDAGYKYYEWKGDRIWIHTNIFQPYLEIYRRTEICNGDDYFKSEKDLRNCLEADKIKLTWFREL